MTADQIPRIVSARLMVEFADGRVCVFEAKDPGPADVLIDHVPADRIMDREQPAYPEMLRGLALIGEPGSITLRIRAAKGHTLRYLDVP